MTENEMASVAVTTFAGLGLKEREHLQQFILKDVSILDPDLLVLSEEYGDFDGANRRIDLLALDRDGSLVVIELKRTNDGGHMELQALRYAAFVSAMTFDDVVAALAADRSRRGVTGSDPRSDVLAHMGLDEMDSTPEISTTVRIILVSADFSQEIMSTVLWLNDTFDMRIRCVQLVPYEIDGHGYVDVRQTIPLPQAEDYQVKIGRKKAERARSGGRTWTRDSFLAALADSGERERAEFLLDQTEAHAITGNRAPLWFGQSPGGSIFLNPGGRSYGPAQLWINKSGRLMMFGNWNQFSAVNGHPGFEKLAVLLGQDHLGPSRGVAVGELELDELWATLVATSELVNGISEGPVPEAKGLEGPT